ncbi:polycystin-1 [Gouania willdenowi]|uniref:polycystin-1 n=1 Tax=Gouania willdenowi TaxID=441366 RepID=UPI001054B1E2|nr:polycystin-1-like [Gouania willdenowi]
MTLTLSKQVLGLFGIICVVLISTSGGTIPCPKGGRINLINLRCYWLSVMTSSWFEAQESCSNTHGGELASAHNQDLQHFIFHSFPVETIEWVWLKEMGAESSEQGDVLQTESSIMFDQGYQNERMCAQMALGIVGRWRKAQCDGKFLYICEMKVTNIMGSLDSYLAGLVLMTGIYNVTQTQPLSSVPDIGRLRPEMQLFPGLWFSHAGQLVSVEVVVQPHSVASLARIQILRPYCNPNHHLVPPGCSSLLNPFSCCSAVPLCNTTGGCSTGQYWCHLMEACMPTTSPCSSYDSAARVRGFALPPRYIALPPFYHLVADLPLSLRPSSELETVRVFLPEKAIMVYPDDIVAIQHTLNPGAFLHCQTSEASLNSPWRQSYLSFSGAEWGGWLEGGLTSLPQESKWVDGVVCDLRMLYVDRLNRATEHEDFFDYTHTEKPPPPLTLGPGPINSQRLKFRPNVIHPLPDENHQIHVKMNVPTLIVVKANFGEKARSMWSAPVFQTGLGFVSSCPKEVIQSSPGCSSDDGWFSFTTLVLPSVGVQTLNITVMDEESIESVTIKVCGHEIVTGLHIETHGCLRMLINTTQSFTAKVQSGTNVKFTWVIDNLGEFAHEGESYSITFKKPAKHKLQSQEVILTVEKSATLTEPEFLSIKNIVPVNESYLYSVRAKADTALPVTFRWDFGDNNENNIMHTQKAPCQTIKGLLERGEKQLYVQDSVNYTYIIPDEYTLRLQVSTLYDVTEALMQISVRSKLKSLLITPSSLVSLVNQTIYLEASVEPSDYALTYTWDFGDNSKPVQGVQHIVRHRFGSARAYNITATASNTLSSLTAWFELAVMEKVSGLTVAYSALSELGFASEFMAEVVFGSNLIWNFDFGDGYQQRNLTSGSISHIYKLPGKYKVDVLVSNSASQAHQSITVEIYKLKVNGILPVECVMSGTNILFTALVNINASMLTFYWQFGDESPLSIVTGQPIVIHHFPRHGKFLVNLTVSSPATSASFTTSICVQSPISRVVVQIPKNVVAVGEQVCASVLVFPEQATNYLLKWFSNASGLLAVTENNQQCFVFRNEGVEELFVQASNKVSNKTAETSIIVKNPVSVLSVSHGNQSNTLMVNSLAIFWLDICADCNMSVLWDFGDGSSIQHGKNVSHCFTSVGQFNVTATAFNGVIRNSTTIKVNVLLAMSEFSLHTNQSFAVVGEETLIQATGIDITSSVLFWSIEGVMPFKPGTDHLIFIFPKPGVYQVNVTAQSDVSKREATSLIEVFERIEGLQIDFQSQKSTKYLPTKKRTLFVASFTKGSNITYHWQSTQNGIRQQTGEEKSFHVVPENPGSITVYLRASNVLGDATSNVALLAVEEITTADIEMESNVVPLGKVVNISVKLSNGSDLEYYWYMDNDPTPLQTEMPFLLYTFPRDGHFLIKVLVKNVIGEIVDTKAISVQEEVHEVDFTINQKRHPFCFNASARLSINGIVHRGSDLNWSWKIRTGEQTLFKTTNQNFIYSFPEVNIYQVFLNVSNGINWKIASQSIAVQDAIENIWLNISKPFSCSGEQVTFAPTISKGTNVSYVIRIQSRDWTQNETVGDQFTTSSLPVGSHKVIVKAFNRVSSAGTFSTIHVAEHIQGFRLLRCPLTLEAWKETLYKADVQSGFPVNFTWIFHLEGFLPFQLVGEQIIFTPPESGLLSIRIQASDGVCTQIVNKTAMVERPVKKVKLITYSERTFVGYTVRFSAAANEHTNVRYLWDFGDLTDVLMTDSNTVDHTYNYTGKFLLVVKVLNNVSYASTELLILAEAVQCSSPNMSFVQTTSTIFRARPSFFEVSGVTTCSAYKMMNQWEIFRVSSATIGTIDYFSEKVFHGGEASPFLLIPKHFLEIGTYHVVFTAYFQSTPILTQLKTKITVLHSPLVAVIKGGSDRLWSWHSDLVLDGSRSQDPDMEPGMENELQYHWICMIMITISNDPMIPVTVDCVSCLALSSTNSISYTISIVLAGQCGQCDDHTEYKWTAKNQRGFTLDLNEVTTTTGSFYPKLVVRSGALEPTLGYTFTLDVFNPGSGQWGRASLVIRPHRPPHGGECDLTPDLVYLLETLVTYNCSGWKTEAGQAVQLIYTFQVVLCQPVSTGCSMLTLYRGTRSTFSSFVPMGKHEKQQNASVISVNLLVEDHLGGKVTALNRSLVVQNPTSNTTLGVWLKNKSQTEFWALTQQGRSQDIIPYSIALTSNLNQMESGLTIEELAERKQIRENVTQALAALPVSSLPDVDQISSALSQSTIFPIELQCEGCQEKLLQSVGRMIHVLKEQMTPAVLPAVDTGKNILNIIGSALAAVSESVSASALHGANQTTLQAASGITLSALGYATALMRILMGSRVVGEPPLSLSTRRIHTVGFQGNPSDLLCSSQSSQAYSANHQSFPTDESTTSHSCQFDIPPSLTAQLKGQRSELVQVLFSTDENLHSIPLLSGAKPSISTNLVAMELTTPHGDPIVIKDLVPKRAIQVKLPNNDPLERGDGGGTGRVKETDNGPCLTVTLPNEGQLNFTIKALEDLAEDSGLYISFNFSLSTGASPVNQGHVKIELNSALFETNASQDSLVREWDLNLTVKASSSSSEKAIFLSPLTRCQYYDVKKRSWSSRGLQPLEGSTLRTAHCLTQHLTMFGASVVVHPGAVVLLPPSAGSTQNMLVGIVCAILLLIHLLTGLISNKLDHLESQRLNQVPLCGRTGLYHYRVIVKTGSRLGSSTSAHVGINLYGLNKSGSRHLQREGAFQRSGLDQFHVETEDNLGEVWKIRLWHDNTGLDPSWYVQHVVVWDLQTDHLFFFLVEDWLCVDNQKNATVEREVLASCPEELTQFCRVLTAQVIFGVVEHHLWLSFWTRPAHSRFSRVQRVTCSALLLHLFLALSALWYGVVGSKVHGEPISTHLLVRREAVTVGMMIAVLLFPLQWILCFLFSKAQIQVNEDPLDPASPVCHSVEMDDHIGQTILSEPSFLSLPDSSCQFRDTPSSLLESKVIDSSILDFWAVSGLAHPTDGSCQEEGIVAWPSCDSLLKPSTKTIEESDLSNPLCVHTSTHQLRRKKAVMQLHLAPPMRAVCSTACLSSSCAFSPSGETSSHSRVGGQKTTITNGNPVPVQNHNLTTHLTLSEEDLLMSIAALESTADATHSNSDSGRDSPRTDSSFSAMRSLSCSSWSEQNEIQSLYGSDIRNPGPVCALQYGAGLYKSPSELSVDSVASTFLPSTSPNSTRSSSTTRIGVARGQPLWLLPPWALSVIYLLVALLLLACLLVVGLYGRFFSKKIVLMWLASALSAFLTSALLLEPLKVCTQALIYTVIWRPVDPEVEEQLFRETTVVRGFEDQSGKVRPLCGYGLLQAKEEARKVRALRSLMRHCVCQLVFLLLVLMVNYQDRVEQRQAMLLHSAIKQQLHTAPPGSPNLTSLKNWSDTEQWLRHTLLPHLYQNPSLRLLGSPQCTLPHSSLSVELRGNYSRATQQLITKLHKAAEAEETHQFKSVIIKYTLYHRESGLFICVSVQLVKTQPYVTPALSVHPFLIPSPSSGSDFQIILMILLLLSALLMMFGELWAIITQRAPYIRTGHCWFTLLQALLALATAILQLCFLSHASSCVFKLKSQPDVFVNFCTVALLAQRSSECAALLLTLLILKLLGTLQFVQRWVVIGIIVKKAWRQLQALSVLVLLLLLLCTHLGNTLFSCSVDGFLSVHDAGVSVVSILRGRTVLRRLSRAHPFLGPLYGILLMGGCGWLMTRLCGALLIRTYRAEKTERFHCSIEPQDYEMGEFYMRRLKLWMGLTKAKQFRHRVKFEGMGIPPSRSSQDSHLSTLSSNLPTFHSPSLSSSISSPRPSSSALSVTSEDTTGSESGFQVQPYLDSLMPCVTALLSRFDRVNQITEDIYDLEVKLEHAQARRSKMCKKKETEGQVVLGELIYPKKTNDTLVSREVRKRKMSFLSPRSRVSLPSSFALISSMSQSSSASRCSFPRKRSSYSESESVQSSEAISEAAKLTPAVGRFYAGSPSLTRVPRRRAWHSGSSHSADATQRASQFMGVASFRNQAENQALTNARPRSEEGARGNISGGVPVKRKAWISEEPETA